MAGRLLRASLALLLVLPAIASAQFSGVVVDVPAGDVLAVRVNERVLHVHLSHVDAPETGQPYADMARRSLAEVCAAKSVTLDELGIDRNRTVFGEAACDGVDAGAEQVRRGFAWVLERDAAATSLATLQLEAKTQRRGLWSDPAPVPPWQWPEADAPKN